MVRETPKGTSVGVDDPYAFVERCDYLTDDGRCRYAVEHGHNDPEFARERRRDELRCPAADPHGSWAWADCPKFRSRTDGGECLRCGLTAHRQAHDDSRPLLEEHHLEYADDDRRELSHEITVSLCRWCHATVHRSWGRVDDDASPDAEALAAREQRRSDEQSETAFTTAADRVADGDE